jgi:high affinity sulfate transporter 1
LKRRVPAKAGGTSVAPAFSWAPGLGLLRQYSLSLFGHDLVAALAVTALVIPQGMAYAELAGLPAVTGLYTTIMALLAYALFGPSRILIVGPDPALAPMIAATLLPLVASHGDPARAVALASVLALLMGGICLLGGIARLGFVVELLSKPVRVGYLGGLAVVIVASQLSKLFGFSTAANGFRDDIWTFLKGLSEGRMVPPSLAIGVASLIVILACRRYVPWVPGVLIAVVLATVTVGAFDLASHGVAVVGPVPSGFPAPSWPRVGLQDLGRLSLAALGLAFVAVTETSVLSRSLSIGRGERVNPNQEMVALGSTSLAAGLFQGFPTSASVTRTTVASTSGSRTQMTGVMGAGLMVVVLVAGHGILRDIPSSVLAAIVIAAAFSLFDLATFRWLASVRKSALVQALTALVGVAVFGVLVGIVVAVALSLGEFVRRAWHPHDATLGRVTGRKGYHDVARHPDARQVPGLLIYRFDAPLFFANAEIFARGIEKAISVRDGGVNWLIVAAEPITDVDTTAAETLGELISDLEREGVTLAFAELKGPSKDRLRAYGLYDRIGEDRFFVTLGKAVEAYVQSNRVPWVDWSDERSQG